MGTSAQAALLVTSTEKEDDQTYTSTEVKACVLQFRGDGQSAQQPHQPSWKPSSLLLGQPVHKWRGAASHPCGGDAVVRAHSLRCGLHESLGPHGAQGVWGARQRGSRRRRREEKASQETWTRQRTRWKKRETPWGPKAACCGQEWGSPQRSQRAAAREAPGLKAKLIEGKAEAKAVEVIGSSDETEEAEEEEENSEEPETRLGVGDKLKGRATQLALGDVKGEEEEASEKEEKRKKRVKRKKKKKKQDPQAQLLAQAVQARAAREAEDKEKKSRKKATEDRKR